MDEGNESAMPADLWLLTGEVLPNQNGAPIRVVSPWKYGFKNAKSIVKINFTDKQPHTLWNDMAANEYAGFYSNVNPNVSTTRDGPQAHERRIDSQRVPEDDSYADVQRVRRPGGESLYAGMDLEEVLLGRRHSPCMTANGHSEQNEVSLSQLLTGHAVGRPRGLCGRRGRDRQVTEKGASGSIGA